MPVHSTLISIRYTFFFFNDTATTEIYTLSLHYALPIFTKLALAGVAGLAWGATAQAQEFGSRSEEHTSELQSQSNLVCRLLLEKKKKTKNQTKLKQTNKAKQE